MKTTTDRVRHRIGEIAAIHLWERQAVRFATGEPFQLASGNRSPIYINCRTILSDATFMRLFAAFAASLVERHDIRADAVAGGETAGIPYAAYVAGAISRPMVYIRKKAKQHGIASRVEGALQPASDVLLVEDLITDGGSKLTFVEAVAEVGSRVSDVLVLFDREQGGEQILGEHGIRLHAIAGMDQTLEVGHENGFLSTEQLQSVRAYLDDPRSWHADRGYDFHGA
jgi:orotate phosphoribosyltransferase